MCIELTNGSIPYLIPTPNSVNEVGFNRDRFLLNPELTSTEDLLAYKFIGEFYFCKCFSVNEKVGGCSQAY